MKILFACGGTGGHINPAIAVAAYLREKNPATQIRFAGSPIGMEAKLVPQAGFEFAPITIKGFQRQLNWHNIKYNTSAVFYLTTASARARRILQDFGPDLVVGTGGYVSGPILRKAAKMGIPTLSHEQNAFPGVTTKLLSRYVDKILLAVPEAQEYLHQSCPCTVVGNPIRESILFADRQRARAKLGVGDRVCILSFGGSQGARRLNEAVAQLMAWHCSPKSGMTGPDGLSPKLHHIHATGMYGVEAFPKLLQQQGVDPVGRKNLDIREYIQDMDDCLAAADLVIGRAGALTLSELQAAGRASILIPSPNVAENHQYHNAMVLQKHDAAIVIEEKNLTGELLCRTVEQLVNSPQRLRELGKHAQELAIVDANQRIGQEIRQLLEEKQKNR